MRNSKRHFAILLLLAIASPAFCQSGEKTSNSSPLPTWQWRCTEGEALFNFNPATPVDGKHSLLFDDLPYASEYTMIVVYKPLASSEAMVWRLDYENEASRGLSTEHILSGNTAIRYTDMTSDIPVINTLRQSAPDSTAPYVRLTLGGDSLGGALKVAEVLYFNQHLDNHLLRRIQSALALRYGVTLGPVDYLDANGRPVWNYDGGLYHHRVVGVGSDNAYRVHQLLSHSEMPEALLTVTTDDLPEGACFFCGDNDAPLAFVASDDFEVLGRQWKINTIGCDNNLIHLTFDTRSFAQPRDSLVLLVDGLACFPESLSPNEVTYSLKQPTTGSLFTLAKGASLWQRNSLNPQPKVDPQFSTQIYPNPSTGNYSLEVSGASWVKVSIYNAQGVLMDSFADSEKGQYRFNGTLPRGNSYYATVTTGSGTQTLKLIVK